MQYKNYMYFTFDFGCYPCSIHVDCIHIYSLTKGVGWGVVT